MKTAGLIGGTTWLSTSEYYRIINEAVNLRLGRSASAKIILHSFNFEEILAYQKKGDWATISQLISKAAISLQNAGVDCLALCANTLHKVIPMLDSNIEIPILHIIDLLLHQIYKTNFRNLGLLATSYTVDSGIFPDTLEKNSDISLIYPNENDQNSLDQLIYSQIAENHLINCPNQLLIAIIEKMKSQGADAIILGCTELSLLIKPSQSILPLFDTTLIHAASIADYIMKE